MINVKLEDVSATATVNVRGADSLSAELVTCPVRGVFLPAFHSDLSPLIVSFLSMSDALSSLLYLRRRCFAWFSHWAAIRQCRGVQSGSWHCHEPEQPPGNHISVPPWFAAELHECGLTRTSDGTKWVRLRTPIRHALQYVFDSFLYPLGPWQVRPKFVADHRRGSIQFFFVFENNHRVQVLRILSKTLIQSIFSALSSEEREGLLKPN